jgi:hypothetical protein
MFINQQSGYQVIKVEILDKSTGIIAAPAAGGAVTTRNTAVVMAAKIMEVSW